MGLVLPRNLSFSNSIFYANSFDTALQYNYFYWNIIIVLVLGKVALGLNFGLRRALTRAALLGLLGGHLHECVQHQSVVQPRVPVLQVLQEGGRARGLRHLPGGQLTQALDEARDVQQGHWNGARPTRKTGFRICKLLQ